MFLGIDHGTTAIRFATAEGRCWELSRREASSLEPNEIIRSIQHNLCLSQVDLVAVTYSMGDRLTKIMLLEDAPNRGLIQQDGAGLHQGGGTRVFEAIKSSGWPAIILPGIHRGSDIDPRLKVFSHGMSPEKVGLAYGIYRRGISSFIISDASSNTVTFGVLDGKLIGALDAPIFAPGLMQGPLDVEAIRNVDAGKMTANQAFTCGGILMKMGRASLDECTPDERSLALESLALFAAMEISALVILLRDLGEEEPPIYLAGSPASLIEKRVSELLGSHVESLSRCAAAQGCAWIAQDIFHGTDHILSISVDERARVWETEAFSSSIKVG
jgi:putative methanogenesis marker protein 12